jgi:hypothetical protein
MRSPCCLYVCAPPNQLTNNWTKLYDTWYVYQGTWSHLNGVIHKSLTSASVSVYVARQQLRIHVPAAINTRNNRRIIGRVIFCTVPVVSKERAWVSMHPFIVARKRFGKNVTAATKNCLRLRILCGLCRTKGRQVISSGLFLCTNALLKLG